MKKEKYNYQRYTIIFDLDIESEKAMVEWLETHKGKRAGYCALMKKALAEMIEKEENVVT